MMSWLDAALFPGSIPISERDWLSTEKADTPDFCWYFTNLLQGTQVLYTLITVVKSCAFVVWPLGHHSLCKRRPLRNAFYLIVHIQAGGGGGSFRSPPACTCVCLHVLLNLVRYMVWNSLCIPCMDSSPTMSG